MKKNVVILFYPSAWPEGERGRIPYALLYLERMIRDFGLEIVLIDEQVQRDYLSLVERVKDRLLLAAVSAMTGEQINGGIKFSEIIKKHSDCKVVWGGWHPTLLPEQTLAEPFIDMVIIGQGELPFRNLVEKLLAGEEIRDIAGVGTSDGESAIVTPPHKFVDINEFPTVDYRLIDLENYVFKGSYSERCLGYFCSHGCPYNCAFCCVAKVYGRKWYKKNIDEIIADLKYFKEIAGIDSVTFEDDNFFVNRAFVLEFCEKIIASKLDLRWDTSAHAANFLNNFSDEDVRLIYLAGCRQIYVGAESGDQTILDLISKGANVEDNLRFVELLRKHDITPMLSTMICFPTKSGQDVDLTIDMIRRAKLLDKSLRIRIFFYTPYPGTDLYEQAIAKGFDPPKELKRWPGHTLRKFKGPWAKKDYRWQMEVFANFYLPLCNPKFYKGSPINRIKPILFFINMIFYPIAYLRFRFNFFKWPIEAVLFITLLRFYNEKTGNNYCLGFESYLD